MKLRALLWLRLLLVAFVVLLSARGSFAANFSLSLNSAAGDAIGKGASKFFDQATATIPNQYANPSLYFLIRSTGSPSESWAVEFRGPADGPLSLGTYEVDTANVNSRDLYQPFFYVRPSGTSVSRIRGQFEVKRMVYSANGGVSLWIAFTQYVNGSSAALTGELKVEAEADLVPNNLAPRVYAGPDLAVEMGAAVPFRAVAQDDGLPNGALSVKWETWGGSALGPILISAPDATETTVTFMAEGTQGLKVTASDGVLSYSRVVTVYVRPTETFNLFRLQLPVRLMNTPAGVLELHGPRDKFSLSSFSTGMAIEVEDTTVSWTEAWDLAFTLPNGLKPSVGTYPVAKTYTSVPGAMAVKIQRGFSGSALPVLGGSVQVLAVEYGSGGSMTRCHALFSLHTDEFTPPVMGEIRFRIDSDLTDTRPFVTAGIDQVVTSLETPIVRGGVLVRGNSASTPEVRWSKVSGPGDVVFTDPAAVVTPVTLSAPGTYVLRLEVTDDSGVQSDEVEITALGYEVSIATKSLGRSDAYFPPLHRITATFTDGVLTFEAVNKKTYSSEDFRFRTSHGQPLPGVYLTDRGPFSAAWMGVPFGSGGNGQFEIKELVLDDRGAVVSAWVTYKINWNGWNSPDYQNVEGEIRFYTAAVGAPANRAPLLDVGPDLVTDSYEQQLVASIADDLLPFGSSLQYSWKLLSGPASVELETPETYKTVARFFEPGVYRFLCTVTDGELTSTDELVVAVRSTNRSYEGLVRVGESIVGRAVIKLTPRNAFTARIQVGKGALNLKGNLADGDWGLEGRDSAGRDVSISLSRTASGEAVTGYISVGGQTFRITTQQTFGSFQRVTREKCPYQGRYTLALLPPQGGPVAGAGYGDIAIQPSGAYRLKGTLADGVPFSIGGNLTIGGDLELYLRLRNGREHVVGAASFSGQGVDGLIGGLGWHREAGLKEPVFGGGLNLSLLVRGSRYQAPPKGTTIFPPLTSATANFRLFDTTFPAVLSPQLTLTGEQIQITGAPEGFTVKFDAKTGYFKGGFKDPVTSVTRSFGGVILQGLKTGAGFFLVEGHSGGVLLQVGE